MRTACSVLVCLVLAPCIAIGICAGLVGVGVAAGYGSAQRFLEAWSCTPSRRRR